MKTTSLIIIFTALAALAACGPKPIAFITIDHPKAGGVLLDDVALYYDHEAEPKGAQVLGHLKETAYDTQCEQAAMAVLVQMQKAARAKGGNAVIHLKPKAKGKEPVSSDLGFWCERKSSMEEGAGDVTIKVWETTWEGDVARMADEMDMESEGGEEEEGGGSGEEEGGESEDFDI
jgi:hypothetical protein